MSQDNTLLNRILQFDINNPEAPAEFREILNTASSKDVKALGEKFNAWKIGCLHHFLLSSQYKVNLKQSAPYLIQQYKAIEHKALKAGDTEILKLLMI